MEAIVTLRTKARKNKDFASADFLRDVLKEYGITFDDTPQGTIWKKTPDIAEDLDAIMTIIITLRQKARTHKNYALADAIRDELQKIDIILEDTPQGTTWKKA